MNRWLCALGFSALFVGIGCNGDDDGIYPMPPTEAGAPSDSGTLDASDATADALLGDADAGVPWDGPDASGTDASALDSATDAPVEAAIPDAAQVIDAASDVVGQ